jgi:hypothetical protein
MVTDTLSSGWVRAVVIAVVALTPLRAHADRARAPAAVAQGAPQPVSA